MINNKKSLNIYNWYMNEISIYNIYMQIIESDNLYDKYYLIFNIVNKNDRTINIFKKKLTNCFDWLVIISDYKKTVWKLNVYLKIKYRKK
jgi:hypothetical protein